jgi:ElaB/YqjD/DUF883 family membrane-anchored ribosome-binding protein
MRNAASHDTKDLAKQIALLRTQLDDLAETVNGTGNSLLHRGQETIEEGLRSARELLAKYGDSAKAMADDVVRLKEKAGDTIASHAEERPFTTLAAILGIGFLAGWLFRRR